eukprot:CAMPEP_0204824758 /NCGR_PEP_ID=MMETSP1346-20131115/2752_1 /ASSEMBLY_ACC=CAM_ASM_000771 /TAXON_ID=215587 /ORGANISM="Aplanochytrium stocchinoi, Strain GSBS06" /LENGTH=472 /DNA_ID=CAMNT_0051952089 /DNA_START=1 /DNA_END=1419 /DNA_ORIENTATION=-
MDIAYHPIKQKDKKQIQRHIKLADCQGFMSHVRAAQLSLVPVPVADVKVQKNTEYRLTSSQSTDNSIVFLSNDSFPTHCKIAPTGISRPKIVNIRGENGRTYKLLVKSGDDLRQDAVMEQLFVLVNELLESDEETRKRNLRLRTYKVLPLSPDAGIIEWVERTMAIGEYLHGLGNTAFVQSAHGRHNTASHCRSYLDIVMKLKALADKKGSSKRLDKISARGGREDDSQLSLYEDMCKCFPPVFHHFFFEMFHDPAIWYQRRLSYTRSVAVNSIVGYIMGIGDRHTQNILIDKLSAELIHIDFGITFEQGKTLRIPELVPFRLTPDIVDGMGVTGTKGVFEGCCEYTLKVLKDNSEVLLTICEVFIHDPLYDWAVSPLKVEKAQPGDSNEDQITKTRARSHSFRKESHTERDVDTTTREAERTLIRLHQKLQGYEDPTGKSFSVNGQVKYLIKEASNPETLCKMYYGWSPFV